MTIEWTILYLFFVDFESCIFAILALAGFSAGLVVLEAFTVFFETVGFHAVAAFVFRVATGQK